MFLNSGGCTGYMKRHQTRQPAIYEPGRSQQMLEEMVGDFTRNILETAVLAPVNSDGIRVLVVSQVCEAGFQIIACNNRSPLDRIFIVNQYVKRFALTPNGYAFAKGQDR